jgi:hypothetical protein
MNEYLQFCLPNPKRKNKPSRSAACLFNRQVLNPFAPQQPLCTRPCAAVPTKLQKKPCFITLLTLSEFGMVNAIYPVKNVAEEADLRKTPEVFHHLQHRLQGRTEKARKGPRRIES